MASAEVTSASISVTSIAQFSPHLLKPDTFTAKNPNYPPPLPVTIRNTVAEAISRFRPTPRDVITGIAPHVFDERKRRPSQIPGRHQRQRSPSPAANPRRSSNNGQGWYYRSPLRRSIVVKWDESRDEYSVYIETDRRSSVYCQAKHETFLSSQSTSSLPASHSRHSKSKSEPRAGRERSNTTTGLTGGHPLSRTITVTGAKTKSKKPRKPDPWDLDFGLSDSDSSSDEDEEYTLSGSTGSVSSSSSSSSSTSSQESQTGPERSTISMGKFRWRKLKLDSMAFKNLMIKIKLPGSASEKSQ